MNILEVNKFYYLRRGAERHFLDLIALLERRGHTVGVLAMEHPQNLEHRHARFFVSFVGYNPGEGSLVQTLIGIGRIFWSFEARRKMRALLEEWRPDVVHTHNIYHQLSPSILGPVRALSIPIVMTVHDYALVSPDKDAYYPDVGKQYWRFLLKHKYGLGKRLLLVLRAYWEHTFGWYEKDIDHYIVPSQYVFDTLKQAGIPETKMTILPHFIANEDVSSPSDTPRQPYSLALGTLSAGKGTNTLVEIFAKLGQRLVLAGGVEAGFKLKENNMIEVVGQKSGDEVRRLIAGARCVVSASILPETFGLVALEAITAGKPFFGLRTGALGEIVENGRNGFLAKDVAELERVLGDFFAGRLAFDAEALQRAARERFGAEYYAKRLEVLYRSLIAQKQA